MKTISNSFLFMCMATMLLFSACKKKENRAYYNSSKATATLEASASSIVLTEPNAGEKVITFTWEKPDFGYSASVTYSLLFDLPADSFTKTIKKDVGVDLLSQSYTVNEMNQIATTLGMPADTATVLNVRMVAQVKPLSGSLVLDTVFSEPVQVKITPYSSEIVYPSIYAVGAFQAWNPAEGIQLYSFNSDNKYEGYINVGGSAAGDFEFKFTSLPDWGGTNYGSAADPTTAGFITTGTLSTDGGAGNLKVPATGYYRIKANTTALTFEAYQTAWGLIGSATPGGWDNSTPMTYDAPNKVWVIASIPLTAGDIKFRANNTWDLSYGADASGAKLTADNGANIAVAEAGNYKVVLDLSNSTNYHYTLTKL